MFFMFLELCLSLDASTSFSPLCAVSPGRLADRLPAEAGASPKVAALFLSVKQIRSFFDRTLFLLPNLVAPSNVYLGYTLWTRPFFPVLKHNPLYSQERTQLLPLTLGACQRRGGKNPF